MTNPPLIAQQRAEAIRAALTGTIEQRDRVLDLIRDAREGEDHLALGYPSWPAYITGEFGDLLPALTREERTPLSAQMQALGMSTRAIARVTGVSQQQVHRDLQVTPNVSPDLSVPVTGLDGKTYTRPTPSPAVEESERRTAAWQPFRALMSNTMQTFIDGADDLLAGHDWTDLDGIHARHGIDSRAVVLDRLRNLRDTADRVLTQWEKDQPNTLRRIK